MPSTISIVVPCFNESEVLPLLFQRLRDLPKIEGLELEYVLVDDGSSDDTWQQIQAMATQFPNWTAIRLSRNFGHQRALWTGLKAARGDAVFVIDADLQDPPELLEEFVDKWRKGHEVVYGVRKKRKEGWVKRTAYRVFYRFLKKVADIEIPLDSGDFCLMDRCVVDQLLSFNEPDPFIRGARAWVGFDQIPLEYERDARAAGREKYGVKQLMELAVNGLLSYSAKPLRLLMIVGLILAGVSSAGFASSLVCILLGVDLIGMTPSLGLVCGSIGFVGGCNLFGIGLVGEYVFKSFEGIKSRPTAVVADTVQFSNAASTPQDVPSVVDTLQMDRHSNQHSAQVSNDVESNRKAA